MIPAVLCSPASAISTGIMGLYPPQVNGDTAEVGVEMKLSITGPEKMVFFAIDVSASDDELTAGGTDYSRFSFELNAGPFTGWDPQLAFGDGPFFSVEEHQTLTDPASRGTYVLGTLRIDLAGLPTGRPMTVSIAGPETAYGTETAGQADFEIYEAMIDTGEQTIVRDAYVIPEPLTLAGALMGLAPLTGYVRRRLA